MIIVAGYLHVHPDKRASYLEGCVDVARTARSAEGCVDFHLSGDPIDPGRINIFEQWESVEAAEQFRGSGTSEDQQATIIHASVAQYEIASTASLT